LLFNLAPQLRSGVNQIPIGLIRLHELGHALVQLLNQVECLSGSAKLVEHAGLIHALAVRPPGIRAFMFKAMG